MLGFARAQPVLTTYLAQPPARIFHTVEIDKYFVSRKTASPRPTVTAATGSPFLARITVIIV